jgi:hypothetical protein
MGDSRSDSSGESRPEVNEPVARLFTCTVCGYASTHPAGPLRAERGATCLNCGNWTVQTADIGDLVETARDIADSLAGAILTERQALAYLLREQADVDRQAAAEAMETTPSNVDNLHRRGREKVTDARRLVDGLQTLQVDGESDAGSW